MNNKQRPPAYSANPEILGWQIISPSLPPAHYFARKPNSEFNGNDTVAKTIGSFTEEICKIGIVLLQDPDQISYETQLEQESANLTTRVDVLTAVDDYIYPFEIKTRLTNDHLNSQQYNRFKDIFGEILSICIVNDSTQTQNIWTFSECLEQSQISPRCKQILTEHLQHIQNPQTKQLQQIKRKNLNRTSHVLRSINDPLQFESRPLDHLEGLILNNQDVSFYPPTPIFNSTVLLLSGDFKQSCTNIMHHPRAQVYPTKINFYQNSRLTTAIQIFTESFTPPNNRRNETRLAINPQGIKDIIQAIRQSTCSNMQFHDLLQELSMSTSQLITHKNLHIYT